MLFDTHGQVLPKYEIPGDLLRNLIKSYNDCMIYKDRDKTLPGTVVVNLFDSVKNLISYGTIKLIRTDDDKTNAENFVKMIMKHFDIPKLGKLTDKDDRILILDYIEYPDENELDLYHVKIIFNTRFRMSGVYCVEFCFAEINEDVKRMVWFNKGIELTSDIFIYKMTLDKDLIFTITKDELKSVNELIMLGQPSLDLYLENRFYELTRKKDE